MNKHCRKRRAHINKKIICIWLLVQFIGYLFVFEGIRLICVVKNINDQNIIRATCRFDLSEIRRSRNSSYDFRLDNGDKIWIPSEMLEHEEIIDTQEQLTFIYVAPKGGIHFSYECIDITSEDGRIHFIDQEFAIKEVKLGIITNLIMAAPLLILCYIPVIYSFKRSYTID